MTDSKIHKVRMDAKTAQEVAEMILDGLQNAASVVKEVIISSDNDPYSPYAYTEVEIVASRVWGEEDPDLDEQPIQQYEPPPKPKDAEQKPLLTIQDGGKDDDESFESQFATMPSGK